ncbi:MAG TPA: histidine kinase [Sphingomonadaceae bacterium]|nr:histidine kinase [Sphingomonadaceae bacterium]
MLSVAGFVAVWLALATLRAFAMNWPDQGGMFVRRLGMAAVAAGLAYSLHLAIVRLARQSMAAKAGAAFCLALPVAAVFSFLNYLVFYRWFPVPSALADIARWGPEAVAVTSIGEGFVDWYFVFAAWVAYRLALDHAAEARSAERSAAVARADAQEARLSMLRLQVDPHFLFNTLNALSSLVTLGQTTAARRVITDLAAFFRAGLTAQPAAEVALAEEVELQRLYLAIERARFGDRLHTRFDIPSDLETISVPALILQPLVENAVKHGVARTNEPVTVSLSARREGDVVRLTVHDDARSKDLPADIRSTGIGLANVKARLDASYGRAAALRTFTDEDGGWTSQIVLPAHV